MCSVLDDDLKRVMGINKFARAMLSILRVHPDAEHQKETYEKLDAQSSELAETLRYSATTSSTGYGYTP